MTIQDKGGQGKWTVLTGDLQTGLVATGLR